MTPVSMSFCFRVFSVEVSLEMDGIYAGEMGIVSSTNHPGIAAKPAVLINALLLECLLIVRILLFLEFAYSDMICYRTYN